MPANPPRRLPTTRTRRHEPPTYRAERLSPQAARTRRAEHAPTLVATLADAGRTGSALRRRLKAADIDPKLARLVLLLYRQDRLRVADVAWALTISPSTASRWLDRAEQLGLIDKQYDDFDRRGTWVRLTRRGVELRGRVELLFETMRTNERPRGAAKGLRSTRDWD